MTDGERTIWAAAYALALGHGETPEHAVKWAGKAICYLRYAKNQLQRAGLSDDLIALYNEMTYGEAK